MIRKYVCVMLTVLTLIACIMTVDAADSPREKDFLGEQALPSDFSFSVQDHCSTHPYFHHALAQNDGKIAVFSHHIDPGWGENETFTRQYVDIYHTNGTPAKEYSFCTQHTYLPVLENDTLYLYFYSYVVVIDLKTDLVHCYDIADAYRYESQQKAFRTGIWEYQCKKSFGKYTTLTRTDGTTEQVIVDMSGSTYSVGPYIGAIMGAVPIIAAGLLLIIYKKRRRK